MSARATRPSAVSEESTMAQSACPIVVGFLAGCVTLLQGQEKSAAPSQVLRHDVKGDTLPTGAISRLGSARLRHGHNVTGLAFSPDGSMLASAGWDHTVRLWDVTTGKEIRNLTSRSDRDNPYIPSRWAFCVAFSPDGKHLACGYYTVGGWRVNTFDIWEVATGKLVERNQKHEAGVLSVAFSASGTLMATASADGTIRLWRPGARPEHRSLRGHKGDVVRSVAFGGDKLLASGGDDGSVRLWEPATGKELFELKGHESGVESVAFSKDGQRLASGSRDGTARL